MNRTPRDADLNRRGLLSFAGAAVLAGCSPAKAPSVDGADGVLMCGCHEGDCHYLEGNLRAKDRAAAIELMLEDFDLEPERYRLEWVAASEGARFAQVVNEMVDAVKEVGPSPYG